MTTILALAILVADVPIAAGAWGLSALICAFCLGVAVAE